MTTPATPSETVEIDGYTFPKFDLVRLLTTVFELDQRETFAVFTDLDDVKAGVAVSHDALGRFSVGLSAVELSRSPGTIVGETSLLLPN